MNRIINNEVLGLLAIQSVLHHMGKIDVSKAYLIVPLIFDKRIRKFLKRKNTVVLSAQELITSKNEFFLGFNEKFLDSLVITTNAIVIGKDLGVFMLEDGNLILLEPPEYEVGDLGSKIKEINISSKNVSKLLASESEELYSLLRLEI
ncbi:three component ABC system middle component [Vibrio owensii]|uniref:three component ABC system middle component n=1 Tax=Vibrio owensii TaxID=696485 RepID=UPI002FEE7B0F